MIVALLLGGALWGGIAFSRMLGRVDETRQLVSSMEVKVKSLDRLPPDLALFDSLKLDLVELESNIEDIRSSFGWLLSIASHLSWVPLIGGDLGALTPLLDAGLATVEAAMVAVDGLDRIVLQAPTILSTGVSGQGTFAQDLETLRQDLAQSLGQIEKAEGLLREVRASDPGERLRAMADNLQSAIDRTTPAIQRGIDLSVIGTQVLGVNGRARYLVIAQNADELRATGGFIPGAWLVEFSNGQMKSLVFYDSPDVDDLTKPYPAPPEWLGKSLWGGIWVFRDATWFPHFPSSAQAAEDLFALGQGLEVDGVIAFDQWTVQAVVDAFGPLTLTGLDQPLTGANTLHVIQQGTDESGRAYLDLILRDLIERAKGGISRQQVADVGSAVLRMLNEKHVLMYLQHAEAQDRVRSRNWDGALSDETGDYLLVVDSNVGYNKVNANIDQAVEYQAFIDDAGRVLGQVSISYNNRSQGFSPQCVQGVRDAGITPYEELAQGCYWDYLRVYLPLGAIPVAWPDLLLPPDSLYARGDPSHKRDTFQVFTESGKTVLGGFFVVPQGDQRTLAFAYQLPEYVLAGDSPQVEYSLVVQKQPGTLSNPLRVVVHFPESWRLKESNVPPLRLGPGSAEFQMSLVQDVQLTLHFQRP